MNKYKEKLEEYITNQLQKQKKDDDEDLIMDEYPRIDTPEELYLFFKLKYSEDISDDIVKDCPRSNFGKCE